MEAHICQNSTQEVGAERLVQAYFVYIVSSRPP